MNLLDRVIMAVAPKAGFARLQARAKATALQQVMMNYDAGKLGRTSSGWRVIGLDANGAAYWDRSKLTETARDLVRNNPFAARAVQVISEGVIGPGIIPSVEASNAKVKADYQALIDAHCDTTAIDADGRHNLYGIQLLAMRSVVESGEVLIRRRPRFAADGLPLPFQLQVLEVDYLDTTKDGPLPSGGRILNGIEYSPIGKRVAYHLYTSHPGNMTTFNAMQSSRISADDVAHIYRMDRPGQMNGVTWFAPVMIGMRDFADYEDAQLVRQKVAASFAVFLTQQEGASGNPLLAAPNATPTDTGLPSAGIEPGMIMRLKPGENATFGVPPQVEGYRDFSIVTLHKIAVGFGVDYASLTGDNSQGNFANSRMGWLRFHRSIESWQWNMFIPAFCDPVSRWLLDGCALMTGRRYPAKIVHTPPRREMFDPSKDVKAAKDAIRAGLSSRSNEVRKLGFDPVALDAENKQDNHRADDAGLSYTSDGRRAENTAPQEMTNDQQTDQGQ